MNDNKMTATELRATWGLGAIFSMRMLGLFMVLPVLTTYGMALAGANTTLIGIAIGIYGLTQAILQIPFGLLSDRIGRKPIIVAGLLIFALGSVVAAMADSVWGVILGRALQGAGAIAAAVMAWLSDLTREQNRTKAMAFIGMSFGVTFALAMVLGPIITQQLGLSALFWGIALLAIVGIIITLTVIPKQRGQRLNRESSMVKSSFHKVLANPQLLKLNLAIMCVHALLMSSFVALPIAMEKAQLLRDQQWIAYLGTMLISFMTVIPFIIYAEKKRRIKSVLLLCITLFVLAEVCLVLAGSALWALIAGMQIFFIGFNVAEAILPSWMSKEAPAGYKGTAMGVYSTCQFLGVAIGGSIGGWLLSLFDTAGVFVIAGLVAALWFFIAKTMQEPAYVSSLHFTLPEKMRLNDAELACYLLSQSGVTEAVVISAEQAAYLKVDIKLTNRQQLEQIIAAVQYT